MEDKNELAPVTPENRLRRGPMPKEFPTLSDLSNPEKIRERLYRTQDLTDDAYCDYHADFGKRLALEQLEAQVALGNIKAVELMLKWVADYERTRRDSKPAVRNVTAGSFIQLERDTPTGSDQLLDNSAAPAK